MYTNGQQLTLDHHFYDHIVHEVPVQIYCRRQHNDIGYVEEVSGRYVKVNDTYYSRDSFTFVSRPGY